MLGLQFTTIREIQRNYKKLREEVNKTDQPTIVMSKNKPQFAIVSIKTAERLSQQQKNNTAKALVDLADWAEEQDFDLPKDLSEKHNEYTWD